LAKIVQTNRSDASRQQDPSEFDLDLSLSQGLSKWKIRFEEHGIEGLQGRHQGSKPRRATPAVQGRVIRRAQQKPSDGSTHWSCRKLADELGVSKSTVQRILSQAKLRPHRLESYMASNDPEFPGLRAKPVASVSTRTLSPGGCHRSSRGVRDWYDRAIFHNLTLDGALFAERQMGA
jgi:transposase